MEHRGRTVGAGLVALALLDIGLIVWALWPSQTAAPTQSTTSVASGTGQPSSEGTAPPPAPTVSADDVAPLVRLVAGVGATTAWLVDGGECGGRPGRLHVTLDNGAEWATQPAPGSVTRIRPSDASSAFVVGGDENCADRVWYTGDRGGSWSPPQEASNAWGRSPRDSRVVLRPGGPPVRPCREAEVLDLVGLSSRDASVLCSDGTIRVTDDSGDTWPTTTAQEDLLAISLTSAGEGAAVGLADDCSGLAIFEMSGAGIGGRVCVEQAAHTPGQVAISITGGAVWLVAGDGVYRAADIRSAFARVATWPEP